MSFKIIPLFINNKNISKDINQCPKCSSLLYKEFRNERECHECSACNLGVLSNCSCYYEDIKVLYIICKTCNACSKCNKQMEEYNYNINLCSLCNTCSICNFKLNYNYNNKKFECNNCISIDREEKQKSEFRQKWKNSSPSDKLNFYGKPKLLILSLMSKTCCIVKSFCCS